MENSSKDHFIYSPDETGSGETHWRPPAHSSAKKSQENDQGGMEKPTDLRKEKNKLPEVIIVRNWKEYAGESLMIVFSVLLALGLTEIFNKIHENRQTHEILAALRQEIIANKTKEDSQYVYHLQVLKNIDSALNNPGMAQKFIHQGEIDADLKPISLKGVISEDLNDVAWQVAKQANIYSKIDFSTYSLLTDIYNNQYRVNKVEEEVGKVILSWQSRIPENLRQTLILMRDNYHGWAVDRAPKLLRLYQQAIEKLNNY